MTWVNATIPTVMEIREEQRVDSLEKERDFWLNKAEHLQRELENIWDHAREAGRIELHHRREKLVLVTEPTDANP